MLGSMKEKDGDDVGIPEAPYLSQRAFAEPFGWGHPLKGPLSRKILLLAREQLLFPC